MIRIQIAALTMDPHKKANLFKSMTGEHLYLLVEMEQHQLHLFLKKDIECCISSQIPLRTVQLPKL